MTTVCGLNPDWPPGVPPSLEASESNAAFYWGSVSLPTFSQRLVVEAALRWCAPFYSLAEFGCHPGIPNLRIAHAICPEAELTGVDSMPEVEIVSPALAATAGMRAKFHCLDVPTEDLGTAWAEVVVVCHALLEHTVIARLHQVATRWLILIGSAVYVPRWTAELGALVPVWIQTEGPHVGMIYRAPGSNWPTGDWHTLDRYLGAA